MVQREHEGATKTGSENYRVRPEPREQVLATIQAEKAMRWKVQLGTHESLHLERSSENLLKNDGKESHKVQTLVSVT